MVVKNFDHKKIDKKWQKRWGEDGIYSTTKMASVIKPFYNLWMFPYPSAEGVHVGTIFSSTGSDVYGRFMRMNGFEVFQPIGYDSFGIHSENYALKIGETPQKMLARTIPHYQNQFQQIGHGYDWTRTVTTSDVDYYKWTQWLFVQLFKAGLAYRQKSKVNWCPSCKTVLADEQVVTPSQAGKDPKNAQGEEVKLEEGMQVCERCGTLVQQKDLEQWFFRITEYADKLLSNLDKINWPEKIKLAQRNWIGKKEGINIEYQVETTKQKVVVWTSRPDTNFGATFIVLAPENPLVEKITTDDNKEAVSKYIEISKKISKEERTSEGNEKTGAFTGAYAVNNVNGYRMPIYVSDFVLMDVGTGAVVGVPGHDKRDFEFAKKFNLPIKRVVVGLDGDDSEISNFDQVQEEEGKMVNSEFLNGLDIHKATEKMMDYFEEKGWGKRETNYHLRDWLISRQRYWGPPIPMIYCKHCANNKDSWFTLKGVTFKVDHKNDYVFDSAGWYPEENLPLVLPDLVDYQPKGTGRGPLADHPEYYEVKCPSCGNKAKRETDVSDTFLDSSWYFLRYPTVGAKSASKMSYDTNITKKWLPVSLYFGGAEHAVLHLMYSRFVTMFLSDLGLLDFEEPFPWFYAHGLMIKDGAKMSKSRGNIVNPDDYIEKFGADTLRLYLMFMGPMDGYPDFRDTGIEGTRRFVERLWDLFTNYKDKVSVEERTANEILVKMHQTIKKVTEDMKEFRYNTAIASIMEFVNLLREIATRKPTQKIGKKNAESTEWNEALVNLCLMLAPFVPHMAEEVWCEVLGQRYSVHHAAWPRYKEEFIRELEVTVVVQINGKVRTTLKLDNAKAMDKENVINKAKADEKVKKWLAGKKIKSEIFIAGKLINLVVT